jgi:sugar/nucleoside kinase (ribokinase family)
MKKQKKTIISGVGCCLVDILFTDINFSDELFKPYLSRGGGDGGLVPGRLVFVEEFEAFAKVKLSEFIEKITKGRVAEKINVGGPSIVALINAAQILDANDFEVRFYGHAGDDANGAFLVDQLKKTPVNIDHLRISQRPTPNTLVLSDPDYDHGAGERLFINSIGAAWEVLPDDLDDGFFDSDIVVFGATALTPNIHDHLETLLAKAKARGCMTIVNTVFDFRNEKKDPSGRWPMAKSDESYHNIDLLIMDHVEALRLSGTTKTSDACHFFMEKGCASFIITNGSKDIFAFSDGRLFAEKALIQLPVSHEVSERLKQNSEGDTTGCGDNFAGGVIASLAAQDPNRQPYITEACSWGVVSGGFSCFYVGGTFEESHPGEKLTMLKQLYESYRQQISGHK